MTPAQRRRRARMKQVVELRAKGFSLRDIAAAVEASYETVRQDLRQAEEVSDSAVKNVTPPVRNPTPELDTNVVQLRRAAR